MEKARVSLAEIQTVPEGSLILLAGPPGAGKSTFCNQVVLNALAMERPVVYVATEQRPVQVLSGLRERGLREPAPGTLSFVDAFSQTVGAATPERPDTVGANCQDLNSISMAIARLERRITKRAILLAFDSLTSPYLFNREDFFRFTKLCPARFAAQGNSALVLMDEGCGKEEDLVAMMSVSDGVIRLEMGDDRQLLSVVKHPRLRPTKIEAPVTLRPRVISSCFDAEYVRRQVEIANLGSDVALRPSAGDYVNIAWRDLVFWSGMLWDPRRFPMVMYEVTKYSEDPSKFEFNILALFPWHKRLALKLLLPRSLSTVGDMRSWLNRTRFARQFTKHRVGTIEYLAGTSKADEHHFRLHEGYECWGFEGVGTSLAVMKPAMMAGIFKGMEAFRGLERDWNAVETRCVGRGDPYCEFKLVPGEIEELADSLEKDSEAIETVYDRLMDHLMGYMLHRKPLMERPISGRAVHIHEVHHVTAAPLVNAGLQTVFRMGGARAGRDLAKRLMDSGLGGGEAVRRISDLVEHCKVGEITFGETIRMKENCESFGLATGEPSCYFTTGFLNGFLSVALNQHVRKTRCIGAGDPYCEWEIV
jgi:predicted hydrocarbon binding protein/KaiC/GvpD/RAD55 family RecA-like ATPase